MLQRYMNKWVATAHDLFGTDSSIRSLGIRLGSKGSLGRAQKLEGEIEVDKEVLNRNVVTTAMKSLEKSRN